MAQLLVRNLKKSLVIQLKHRALKNGHSAEEEHRLILQQILMNIPEDLARANLKDYLVSDPMPEIDIPLPERNHPQERTLYTEL